MKITGEVMIFRSERGYSTTISNKKEDGTYENMYLTVNFKKGIEIENKTKINIINGFLTFYTNNAGNKIPKLVITEFGSEGQPEYEMTQDDLPF